MSLRIQSSIPKCVYSVDFPSHTTTIHQPLDNRPNAFFAAEYSKIYTSAMALHRGRALTNTDKLEILTAVYQKLQEKSDMVREAWVDVGLPRGMPDPMKIKSSKYNIGQPYRNDLPPANSALMRDIFSTRPIWRFHRALPCSTAPTVTWSCGNFVSAFSTTSWRTLPPARTALDALKQRLGNFAPRFGVVCRPARWIARALRLNC